MKKVKQCAKCGETIIVKTNRQKYCPVCAKLRQTETAKERRYARQRRQTQRKCPICGKLIEEKSKHYCDYCRSLSPKERQQLENRIQAEKKGPSVLSINELVELTKQYRPPYSTYGKLKSYIDVNGKLPPDEFRR